MARISVMTMDDIDFAISMTDFENWGNIPSDFDRLLRLEPEGCFVARESGQRVGMITTTSSDDYAFMGSLIVKDGFRRRGVGYELMQSALAYLQNRNIASIELDATFEGVPLYRKLGFKDKYLSFRMRRNTGSKTSGTFRPPHYSLEEILDLDKKLTGLNRRKLLSAFIEDFPGSVILSRDGHLNGYAVVFPRKGNLMSIGPVIAEYEGIAGRLIEIIVVGYGSHELAIGLPETAAPLTGFLLRRGFEYRVPSLRMYLGGRRNYESSVFGIVSPEKG